MIRRLVAADAADFLRIRREALAQEPLAFCASPEDDRAQSAADFERYLTHPTNAAFGAFAPELVGIVGVVREVRAKTAHRAQVWGVYVTAAHRGQGHGRALVEAAIGYARSLRGVTQLQLAVTEPGKAALKLYERAGFVVWGTEPDAIRVDGAFVAEHHMVLTLGPDAG
jgi:ribosomal protein S18 acetylase RimI-like enzyme